MSILRISYILRCDNEIFAILFRNEKDEFICILAEDMEDLDKLDITNQIVCDINDDFYLIEEGTIKGLTFLAQLVIDSGLRRLVIPKMVNGMEVKALGRDSFRGLNIETVILAEGIEKIDKRAFKDSKIEYLKIPNSITIIEEKSFKDCINLELVEFGENLEKIGSYCFNGCRNLSKVLLPKETNTVMEITITAFSNTGNFEIQLV